MASKIHGPLYYERMGRAGPVMAFLHPNPMDLSCWIFQLAHLSTWFRCIAIDIPGYGRSPPADAGLAMTDIAEACWEILDGEFPGEKAVLVGCSVGSALAVYMHHRRADRVLALVLSGAGYQPDKAFAQGRIKSYSEQGLDYRWTYTFEDFSPAFRASPMAHYFADMFAQRNRFADLQTILRQFTAHAQPDAADHYSTISAPTLILTGTEDGAHASAYALKEQIPGCALNVLPGAGHACQIEQPWLFDRLLLDFLKSRGLFHEEDGPSN